MQACACKLLPDRAGSARATRLCAGTESVPPCLSCRAPGPDSCARLPVAPGQSQRSDFLAEAALWLNSMHCCPQEFGIVGYTMNLSMIEYKTHIIREDLEAAAALLPSIPKVHQPASPAACSYCMQACSFCRPGLLGQSLCLADASPLQQSNPAVLVTSTCHADSSGPQHTACCSPY